MLLLSVFPVLFVLFPPAAGAGQQDPATPPPANATAEATPVADQPLAEYRQKLLELAFQAATAMPADPHIKDRSRAQGSVAEAWLQLDQPRRALACAERIDSWQRGLVYAQFALYCAQHGDAPEATHYLDLAREISERGEDWITQDWQKDRIRATSARAWLVLGQSERAAESAAGLVDSESGAVAAAQTRSAAAEDFERALQALDAAATTGNFDQLRNALEVCVQLVDRGYDDAERRTRTEDRMRDSWKRLPGEVRFDLMLELAGVALTHQDPKHALAWTVEAQQLLDSTTWTPEFQVPLMARVAAVRFRAGEPEPARKQADAALALYDAQKEHIVNIYRADALRPLAEAYQAMGDAAAARSVYRRAVDAGLENPNSRPRAEDLVATCCSMAVNGVEPDEALLARLNRICQALGDPW